MKKFLFAIFASVAAVTGLLSTSLLSQNVSAADPSKKTTSSSSTTKGSSGGYCPHGAFYSITRWCEGLDENPDFTGGEYKKDIAKYQRQIYDLTVALKKKFQALGVITILEELNEKVLKTNESCLNYSKCMIQELNKIIPNNNNPNKDKNLNPTSQKYENDKVQNSTTKSVYERININQSKQNQTGPAPQIKSPGNLGKEY